MHSTTCKTNNGYRNLDTYSTLAAYCLRRFELLLCNCWTEFMYIWQKTRSQRPEIRLWFWAIWKAKLATSTSGLLTHFDVFSSTAERISTKPERRKYLVLIFPIKFVFFGQLIISMCSIPKKRTHVHDCGPFGLPFFAGVGYGCCVIDGPHSTNVLCNITKYKKEMAFPAKAM